MGNTKSEFSEKETVIDPWWGDNFQNSHSDAIENKRKDASVQTSNERGGSERLNFEEQSCTSTRKKVHTEEEVKHFEDTKLLELRTRRLTIIAEKKKEMDALREENSELRRLLRLEQEKGDDLQLKEKLTKLEEELEGSKEIKENYDELTKSVAKLREDLQTANREIVGFDKERQEYNTHVIALKDIIAVSKQLLLMRETQIKELTDKVKEIETSLAKNEMKALADDLKEEYARQLANIRQLRTLYEQRQSAVRAERDELKSQLDDAKVALEGQQANNTELEKRVEELEKDNSVKYDKIVNMESTLGLTKAECKDLKNEMSVINQLFSQILLGFNNGQGVDLDKLIQNLEDNRDLLTNIVVKEGSSALPKVFLNLVNQVNEKTDKTTNRVMDHPDTGPPGFSHHLETIKEESESQTASPQSTISSASEIAVNLPKVWKVLTELLSQQNAPINVINEEGGDENPCYKSIETPTGPQLVLSVSKTFIRLKDLILEKKSLEQEMENLKRLNTHLETRLHDQEKRFETVSSELAKTWNVVGKMQKQHQQLHTQEKILRHELAQKRKLLTELKQELEYCREKWIQAREKNSTTEQQWKQLRNEFASRKSTPSDDLNNSIESGYSDERESSSEDEDGSLATQEPEVDQIEPEDHLDVLVPESNEMVLPEEVISVIASTIQTLEDETDLLPLEAVAEEEILESETLNENVISEIDHERRNDGEEEIVNEDSDVVTVREESNKINVQEEVEEDPTIPQGVHSEILPKTDSESTEASTSRKQDIVETYKKLERDILLAIKKTQSGEANTDQIFSSREERLKRLEEQSNDLIHKATATSHKSIQICNRLDDLHEKYGKSKSDEAEDVQHTSADEEERVKELETEDIEDKSNENENLLAVAEASTSKVLKNEEVQPCSSSGSRLVTLEERLAAREERLKRLEKQSSDLVEKTRSTMSRSLQISNALDNLHEQYGGISSENQELANGNEESEEDDDHI